MPVSDYVCKICRHKIKINYLEAKGSIETPCACDWKIVVDTDDQGKITAITEVPPPKKKKKINKYVVWTIVAFIAYNLLPNELKLFLKALIKEFILVICEIVLRLIDQVFK